MSKGVNSLSNYLISQYDRVVLSSDIENSLMAKCEREQRVIDRFWGFEEEAENRRTDLEKMANEDEFSFLLSQFLRSEARKRQWEKEHESIKQQIALKMAIVEDQKRHNYIQSFFQARSVFIQHF